MEKKENINIDIESLKQIMNWEAPSNENGVLSYNKIKNDLTGGQTITLAQKDNKISFKWVKSDLLNNKNTVLFHFKAENGQIIESSPDLANSEHFDALMMNVANTVSLMDKKPSFQFTGYTRQYKSLHKNVEEEMLEETAKHKQKL